MSDSLPSSTTLITKDALQDQTQGFPSEIMAKIFILVCGQGVRIPPEDHGYPWIIGHVCSRWRDILWDTPSIWNKITIGYRDTTVPETRGSADSYTAQDVLSHILSGIPCPVSLIILDSEGINLGSIISKYCDRFTALSINGFPQHILPALLGLPKGSFVQLENISLLSLCVDGHFSERNTSPLQTAPKLHSVMYRILPPSKYIPSLLILPWGSIRNIDIGGMGIPPSAIWNILQSSPSLVTCCLLIDTTQEISEATEFVLPTLETLRLQTEKTFDWRGFLRPLVTPSLKFINLISPHIPCTPVTSLITRSRCSVEVMDIVDIDTNEYATDPEMESLLDHFSSLTVLKIPWSVPPSLFQRLYNGEFPKITRADISVQPDAFEALLNILDLYIVSPPRHVCDLIIKCREGPGLMEQEDRYLSNCPNYDSVGGLTITVFDYSYSTVRPLGM